MPHGERPELLLDGFVPYRLNRAAELISREFSKLYRDRYAMTRPEWRCLATLGQFGRVTATQVSQHSAMHKTKVSRAVSALEARRWLTRSVDEADRRVECLELSPAGFSAYKELASVANTYQQRLLGDLGDCGSDLLKVLDALEARAKL